MIKYRGVNWKYVLEKDFYRCARFAVEAPWRSATGRIHIRPDWLVIEAGYAWDGASGPTIDTENTMQASLVHDALYQAIREGCSITRRRADRELRRVLREDGMSLARRWLWYWAVRLFAAGAAKPKPPAA